MANVGERTLTWLRDEAKKAGADVQAFVQAYVIERFMERLMRLDKDGAITIKGGQSLGLVLGNEMRATKDLDLNVELSEVADVANREEWGVELARRVCRDPVEDGVTFDPDNVAVTVREHQGEEGLRLVVPARVHTCKADFVIDIGVGNEMSFEPLKLRVDGVLAKRKAPPPPAEIRVYPLENTIAEKIASKIEDGPLSIRHKDFYDLWILMETALRLGDLSLLSRGQDGELSPEEQQRVEAIKAALADGTLLELPEIGVDEQCLERLGYALKRTFEHRGTPLPDSLVDTLKKDFVEDDEQPAQWANWVRNNVKRLRFRPPMTDAPDARKVALKALIDRLTPFLEDIRARVPEPERTSEFAF